MTGPIDVEDPKDLSEKVLDAASEMWERLAITQENLGEWLASSPTARHHEVEEKLRLGNMQWL